MSTPPTLVLAWKRPEATQRLLDRIREASPSALFISLDGQKPDSPPTNAKVQATRRLCEAARFDFPVFFKFSPAHRGLRVALTSAIDWFMNETGEGIILEDDLYPNDRFFEFARLGLDRYRNEARVSQICGVNHAVGAPETDYPFFSRFQHIWGFATWQDRWAGFTDFLHRGEVNFSDIQHAFPDLNDAFHRHWLKRVRRELSGSSDTWTASWNYYCASFGRISLIPTTSLVANLGFDSEATHSRRVPLLAGPPPTDRPVWSQTFLPDLELPDYRRDQLVANTQWHAQARGERFALAILEILRRWRCSLLTWFGEKNQRNELTVAQRYFVRYFFGNDRARSARPPAKNRELPLPGRRLGPPRRRVPVLVIGWRRPVATGALLARLQGLGFTRVYVALDGPRPGQADQRLCNEVLETVSRKLGPDSDRTLVHSENLGLRRSVISALNWFFEHEKQGIILEDDCHISGAGLDFLEANMTRFASDRTVSQVAGSSHLAGVPSSVADLYLSKFHHIWGFATWRKSWEGFSEFFSRGERVEKDVLRDVVPGFSPSFYHHWASRVNDELSGNVDTWDSSWNYYNFLRGTKSVTPVSNLVQNVGFGPSASNSKSFPLLAGIPVGSDSKNVADVFASPDCTSLLDNYVARTQWSTQPPLLRATLAVVEYGRRILPWSEFRRVVRRGNSSSSESAYLTAVQRLELWKLMTRLRRLPTLAEGAAERAEPVPHSWAEKERGE